MQYQGVNKEIDEKFNEEKYQLLISKVRYYFKCRRPSWSVGLLVY